MRSAHVLRRSGWTTTLSDRAGDHDRGAPDRVDPSSCYLNTIRFANGSQMDRYGQYVKAPAGGVTEVRGVLASATARRPRRGRRSGRRASRTSRATGRPSRSSWRIRAARAAASCRSARRDGQARRTGRRRASRRRSAGGPRLYGGTELTPEGEKAAAAFKREDNPRFSCLTTSILFDWTFDGR
jgi:hypothetical protein